MKKVKSKKVGARVKTVEKRNQPPLQLQTREWIHRRENKCEMVKYKTKTHNTRQTGKRNKKKKKEPRNHTNCPSPLF